MTGSFICIQRKFKKDLRHLTLMVPLKPSDLFQFVMCTNIKVTDIILTCHTSDKINGGEKMSHNLNTVKSPQQLKPGKPQTQSQSKSASVASHRHERVNTLKAPPRSLFERGRPIYTLRLIPVPITLPSTEITVQHKGQ